MSHPHPQQEDLLIYSWGQESPGWNLTQRVAQTKEGLHGAGVGAGGGLPCPLQLSGREGSLVSLWLHGWSQACCRGLLFYKQSSVLLVDALQIRMLRIPRALCCISRMQVGSPGPPHPGPGPPWWWADAGVGVGLLEFGWVGSSL